MDSAFQVATAEELKGICDVDYHSIPGRLHIFPSSLRRLHLQACHRLMKQESECVVVSMTSCPDVSAPRILLFRARMVLHVTQILETLRHVAVPLDEEVLIVQLKHEGKQSEQWQEQFIVNIERECLDLLPVIDDKLWVWTLVLGRELGDVVTLVIVAARQFASGLGLVASEVTIGSVALEPQLLVEREFKNSLAEGILAAHLFISEAVTGDVKEAWLRRLVWVDQVVLNI